ncbi:hypothetical protein GW17_00031344 [Ensete ventricosum]|nr:hypothetical protein GW17_00031344 [Ensete ventricosum]
MCLSRSNPRDLPESLRLTKEKTGQKKQFSLDPQATTQANTSYSHMQITSMDITNSKRLHIRIMVHYRPKSPISAYKTYLYLQAKIGHKTNQTRAAKPTASPLLAVQESPFGGDLATEEGNKESLWRRGLSYRIEKVAGNMMEDHRRKIVRLTARMLEVAGLLGVDGCTVSTQYSGLLSTAASLEPIVVLPESLPGVHVEFTERIGKLARNMLRGRRGKIIRLATKIPEVVGLLGPPLPTSGLCYPSGRAGATTLRWHPCGLVGIVPVGIAPKATAMPVGGHPLRAGRKQLLLAA